MLTVQWRGLEEAIRDLKRFRETAIPFALRNAVNTAAFEGRRVWAGNIRETLTTRNHFTAGRALVVEKARGGNDPRHIFSVLGTTAEFMAKQEFGGSTMGPIPGPTAAGQAAGAKRTKPVRMGNRLRSLQAAKASRSVSRRQRNAIAIAVARRRGLKHVILDRPAGGKGLFRLMGRGAATKTRLLWALNRGIKRVSVHATLGPTMQAMQPKCVHIYTVAVLDQLRRHRILGY